ncbi:hypothetical protein LNKW23_21990 [Paralimibaculum aggregatum]|uniref:VWFA domain-containing protein n=1 Tax=Paralimibaculum aggregatum TaxID=3036245 RepID=A0ABQ6LQJ3_9RHOB|nr:VWA domain-containing protein [Limibaculum sp. NKW23]GMG82986.1 hypothetical protein LNKW23_21990 [Limibaculum sp. NKW23]
MTDELERLHRAFEADRAPAPREAARKAALAAALAAFEASGEAAGEAAGAAGAETAAAAPGEKISAGRQEAASGARLRRDRAMGLGRILRSTAMKISEFTRPRTLLMGGASLAVIALAVVAALPQLEQADFLAPEPTGQQTADLDGAEGNIETGTETGARSGTLAGTDERRADAPADAPAGAPADAKTEAEAPARERAELDDTVLAEEAPAAPPPMPEPEPAPQVGAVSGGAAGGGLMSLSAAPTARPAPAPSASRQLSAGRVQASPEQIGRLRAKGLAGASDAAAGYAGGIASAPAPAEAEAPPPGYQEQGRDRFEAVEDNPVKLTAEAPVSTFSIDVDTASYGVMRKMLNQGVLPQKDAIRVEELINYFPYTYAPPETAETPFATHVAVFDTPWNAETQLVRIGLKGYELTREERPKANLVFLIDTSGSMNAPDKLPLLLNAFRLLVDRLGPEDRVAIVTYAGSAGTVLEPTPASEKGKILAALDRLSAGGSTAGGEGIRQAYALAEANMIEDGVNRVILATDGDFNVGIRSTEELQGFVERKRETGVLLSVFGFGQGNYNDALMQALAQNGNGQAAYIDTLSEARKVLGEEAGGTLFPIAQDVKIQVEFNPATVAEYRLIGYETRALKREDFNNDKVDAGEIGSGHRVTALYEITPVASAARLVDDLRYAQPVAEPEDTPDAGAARAAEFAFLKIRYKRPGESESNLITRPITRGDVGEPDTEARFAAAVAGFGQLLRGGRYTGDWDFPDAAALAAGARGDDPWGYRSEFVQLVRLAESAAALSRQR